MIVLWFKSFLATIRKREVMNMLMRKPENWDAISPREAVSYMELDDSLAVANSILDKAFSENKPITNLKLQKLLYLVYKHYLQKNGGEPLFGEAFEAWPLGPVLPSVYHVFKYFEDKDIVRYAYQPFGNPESVEIVDPNFKLFYEVLDDVWAKYGKRTASDLVELTHHKDSAWSKVKEGGGIYLLPEDVYKERVWD